MDFLWTSYGLPMEQHRRNTVAIPGQFKDPPLAVLRLSGVSKTLCRVTHGNRLASPAARMPTGFARAGRTGRTGAGFQ